MNKKSPFSRLGLQLTAAAVLSLVAGVALFFLFTAAVYQGIDTAAMNPTATARREAACAKRLQHYVTTHDMKLSQIGKLEEWAAEENVLITVYRGREILYYNTDVVIGLPEHIGMGASDGGDIYGAETDEWEVNGGGIADRGANGEEANEEEANEEEANRGKAAGYDIHFQDGMAEAVLLSFVDSRYYLLADLVGAVISMIAALAVLYGCIRRKVRYITMLESELQILKGGDLSYSVTVKGSDELSALAEEIDAMRRSIWERQQEEERAIRANRELVTAMSHDLRTPLTALLGYVDILNLHRYQEGQREKYIRAIGEKAYQIKDMSDKLFEYFLVYRKEREELNLLQVNGIEFLGQVVEESLFDMESRGFQIERISDEIDCMLQVDIELIRRVFGNIFSNLLKYADQSQPVQVCYEQRDGRLTIHIGNTVAAGMNERESNRIGLKTCEKILEDHGGRFECRQDNGRFEVLVSFPCSIGKMC